MVRVDEPCSERWDGMSGDERRRFCATCRKHVHDLSAMTRQEAQALLRTEAEPCVRFTTDGRGRMLHRGAMAAGALLAAAPALASSAPAQEPSALERLRDAVVAWWTAEEPEPEEPEPAAPEPAAPIDTGVPAPPASPPERVRHVTMGRPVAQPRPVVAGTAEVELASTAGVLSLEIRCTQDGYRERSLPDQRTLSLGRGDCTLLPKGSFPPFQPAPIKVGDHLVCEVADGAFRCAPKD